MPYSVNLSNKWFDVEDSQDLRCQSTSLSGRATFSQLNDLKPPILQTVSDLGILREIERVT